MPPDLIRFQSWVTPAIIRPMNKSRVKRPPRGKGVERISDVLPEVFAFSHDYAFLLHDTLAHFLTDGMARGLFSTTFELRSEDEREVFRRARDGEDIFSLLERMDRGDVIGDLLYRRIFSAILGDACHFLYEGLRCTEKGKLTVAYALFRKPLKESLFHLEHLLADPEHYLTVFWKGSPGRLELSQLKKSTSHALDTIRLAVSRTLHAKVYDAQFLYEARFDKSAMWGLEPYWQQAHHLVTHTVPTERQNLNFIFSNEESLIDQRSHIYGLVPFILYYMVDVCTSLMLYFEKQAPEPWAADIFRRQLGFVIWGQEHKQFSRGSVEGEGASEAVRGLELTCPHCHDVMPLNRDGLKTLYHGQRVPCPRCHRRTNLEETRVAMAREAQGNSNPL